MKIRVGYELIYDFPQPTPMIMVLGTHFTRASDIVVPDHLMTSPSVPISPYRDVLAIGAAASSLPPAGSDCGPMASSTILGGRTRPRLGPHSMQLRTCQQKR
jgi:hypothetical protein